MTSVEEAQIELADYYSSAKYDNIVASFAIGTERPDTPPRDAGPF
jgi:hypothetical protein